MKYQLWLMYLSSTVSNSGRKQPVACGRSVIEGQDGRYLVDCDKTGYTITSENDGSVVRLDFNADEQTWSVRTPTWRKVWYS